MVTCYLGIGSNLGNRRRNIALAIQRLNTLKDTRVLKVSKIIETKPVGGPSGQRKFLNAALKIETKLSALHLLRELKSIEQQLGRKRSVRFGPRTIDLDILFYGNEVINREELKVPHPRIFEREFVVKPLLEIL
ncbi:MAG: 2-amino-4-hydroxy-6-hydroxymethyldihydropteridine diphosphokinase [Candidatus Jordarchaeaceae archaeon]